jgi:twitching motility two-component system response regulator PilG
MPQPSGRHAQPSAVDLLREAMAAARGQDKARTRDLLRQATALDPHSETAWLWLAGVAESPLEATTALERVLALNPNHEKAIQDVRKVRLEAGIQAARAKDLPTARRLLRTAVADDPTNETGWVWLAGVTDSPTEAIGHLEKALAINPALSAAKKGIEYYQKKLAGGRKTGPLPAAATPTPPPGALKAVRGGPALVVDPSRTLRLLIGLTLAADGFTPVEAEDLAEALEAAAHTPPAVLVTAASLPGGDGYDLVRRVRERRPVPAVLLTDRVGTFDKVRGQWAGVDAHLPKPLRPAALRAAVAGRSPAGVAS